MTEKKVNSMDMKKIKEDPKEQKVIVNGGVNTHSSNNNSANFIEDFEKKWCRERKFRPSQDYLKRKK